MAHGGYVRDHCASSLQDGILLPRTQGLLSLKAKKSLSAIQQDLL